jgi:hypothetical protein
MIQRVLVEVHLRQVPIELWKRASAHHRRPMVELRR